MPRSGDIISARRSCDVAPTFECHCGIYGVDRRDVYRFGVTTSRCPLNAPLVVIGRVSLWGHWVRNEHGWRAQYAYPYDLCVQRAHRTLEGMEAVQVAASKLRSQYLVDVTWE
jgi:hypothetical protein